MSMMFRGLLIVVAVGFFIWVMLQIRKSRMRIEDSVFWIFFSVILIVLGLFPGILTAVAKVFSIYSPVNFLFLVIIFILIIKLFRMSIRVSKLESKIQNVAQMYAIEKHEKEKTKESDEA